MLKKLTEYYNVLKLKPWWINNNSLCITRTAISLLFAVVAFIMLMLNIREGSEAMAMTSVILIAGFLISAFIAGKLKMAKLSAAVMAVLVSFVMTFFALSGGNEGFAILWMLLIPMFAINLLGVKTGLWVSMYFIVFTAVLFWSPFNYIVAEKYTHSFISKYPILFICDTVVSVILSLQKEYYNRKVHFQSHIDGLTGAYNRRYFMEYIIGSDMLSKENVCIMVIDVNGLKKVNDTIGHEAGDELICAVPECCGKVFGDKVKVCRIGGDEFVLILNDSAAEINSSLKLLKEAAQQWQGKYSEHLCFSAGWASSEQFPEMDMAMLFSEADKKMYAEKTEYYRNRCCDQN